MKALIILQLLTLFYNSMNVCYGLETALDAHSLGPCIKKSDLLNITNLAETVTESSCRLIDGEPISVDGKKLSHYWAQEIIGTGFAKDELDKALSDQGLKCAIPVGVWDAGFIHNELSCETNLCSSTFVRSDEHGTEVGHLITDDSVGTSRHSFFSNLADTLSPSSYSKAVDNFLKLPVNLRPRIINNSMYWDEPGIAEALAPALDSGVVFVTTAGNMATEKLSPGKCESGAIIVGSLHPMGGQSDFSQQASCVTVSAPSDNFIFSKLLGKDHLFGGTSAAAPLVTGSLANVECLLPNITIDESKTLLKNTSVPTLGSLGIPQTNGAGLLNSFLLVKSAQRISKTCGIDHECRIKMLKDPQTYDFSLKPEESKLLKLNFTKIFPGCSPDSNLPKLKSLCNDQREALALVHKQALLERNNAELWKLISCAYSQMGYSANANFYATLGREHSPSYAELKKLVPANQLPRTIASLSDSVLMLQLIKETKEPQKLSEIAKMTAFLGKDAVPVLQELLGKSNDWSVQSAILIAAGDIGENGVKILEIFLKSNANIKKLDGQLRLNLFSAIKKIGSKALPLMRVILDNNDDQKILGEISSTCSLMGSEAGKILEDTYKKMKTLDK